MRNSICSSNSPGGAAGTRRRARSSRFTELVGETPSAYRARDHSGFAEIPSYFAKIQTRPIRN